MGSKKENSRVKNSKKAEICLFVHFLALKDLSKSYLAALTITKAGLKTRSEIEYPL